MRKVAGYAEDAVCPKCATFTLQRIVRRGIRRCMCGHEFKLTDARRVSSVSRRRKSDDASFKPKS